MQYDVLIIGAGAAGLMAMKELVAAGYNVCTLEATAAAGGRIATIHETGFDEPTETGAEFIHGNLALTMQLVKEAVLTLLPVKGRMINVQNGKWITDDPEDLYWHEFMHKLHQLKNDTSIESFSQQYFAEAKYASLRKGVQHYAEGFDLADISKASAFFIRDEWSHQDEPNYRIKEGYGKLIAYLENYCRQQHAEIFFNHPVYKTEHSKKSVTVYTTHNKIFEATKLIITTSLGVLQKGSIEFVPAFTTHAKAIQQSGFGAVIKFLFQFKNNFWKNYADNIGFIISDENIPTWWTQFPQESNVLTGWLGGPKAAAMATLTDEQLLQTALQSLTGIFKKNAAELQQQLIHHKIICWYNKPYIHGGYSYNTIDAVQAKKILAAPVNDTIFFAGEAFYTGASQGTVEAALQSGKEAAQKLMTMF